MAAYTASMAADDNRKALPWAAWVPHCLVSGPSARTDLLRGFEVSAEAASDRYGIFHSLTAQATGLAGPSAGFCAAARADAGVSSGMFLPPVYGSGYRTGLLSGEEVAWASGIVSPDPFYVRTGAQVKTANENPALSRRAGVDVRFGDLIRVQPPPLKPAPVAAVQFVEEWTFSQLATFPFSFPASAPGIYHACGSDPSLDTDVPSDSFLLGFNDGISESRRGGCGGGEVPICLEDPYFDPRSIFLASCLRESVFDGNRLSTPRGLLWEHSEVRADSQWCGDGALQFTPLPPFIIGGPAVSGSAKVAWTFTALVPVNQDLYLSGGWGAVADCDAPDCHISFRSFNSAAISVVLPEGYSLSSEPGFRCAGLIEGPGDPVQGEIPEPGTATLLAAGLFGLAALRRGGRKGAAGMHS